MIRSQAFLCTKHNFGELIDTPERHPEATPKEPDYPDMGGWRIIHQTVKDDHAFIFWQCEVTR